MIERRNAMVELVNREGSVTFAELKSAFPDVSDMTLRTDLKALDSERRLIRIHNGARSVEHAVGTDGLLGERAVRNVGHKREIARKAAALVRPDTTIFLDSGSTTTQLASLLEDMRLIAFTNSVTCIMELARLERASVIVPGGRLNSYSMCLAGSRASSTVSEFVFDQMFLGVTSYDESIGFSCGSDEEANFKRACMRQATKTIVLMDSDKVGKRSTFSICDLADVDVIVSDGGLPSDFIERCRSLGVEVI